MPLDKVRAPYGFVPLASEVVFPDWAESASQDWPLEHAVRGHVEVEIEAQSPLFVRDPADPTAFFRAPDGRYGIPGSSLRGMLRNVVEIASFGKLNRFDRRRYGVRDLHNRDVYGSHMAEIRPTARGKNEPMPLVNAGWLVPVDDADTDDESAVVARIEPCHFAKIEYAEIGNIARELEIPNFDPGRPQSAADKYRAWRRAEGKALSRSFGFAFRPLRTRDRDLRLVSDYGAVTGPGRQQATLVFTGQPSRYDPNNLNQRAGGGKPKHHDFAFYGDAGRPIEVTRSDFRDFEFIHSDGGEQHRLTGRLKPNPEWGFWQEKAAWHDTSASEKRRRVPVFFLLDEEGHLRAFGLAMMFRLAYRYGTEDAVRNGQPDFDSARLDLAEALFGRVGREKRNKDVPDALKGRVGVGFAPARDNVRPMDEVRLVLGTPKASYYPNYVEQQPELGHGLPPARSGREVRYTTYMDEGVQIRGWKRYRPLEGHEVLRPPMPTKGDGRAMDTSKIETRFRPLPARARFTSKLRLHNMLPVEVGALLWAVELGGDPYAFHKLGLARPMGYGTVRLTVVGHQLHDNVDAPVDLATCRRAFAEYMEHQVPGWSDTPQIREFLALARPMPKIDARHMQINHPEHRNEFAAAKQSGLALGAASTRPVRPQPASPAATANTSPRADDLPATGARCNVKLTDTNRRGKWRFELPEGNGRGTIVFGTAPPNPAAGMNVTVEIRRVQTRTSIEAGWAEE